jgi:hypothetical protein
MAPVAIALTSREAATVRHRFAGVANSLIAKLASGSIRAFTNKVDAQRGKHFQADKADVLIRLASEL